MFKLRWKKTARDQLTSIWLDASSLDRKLITEIIHRIEQALKTAPLDRGESRSDEWRVLFEPPLGILFQVSEENGTVVIGRIWRYS